MPTSTTAASERARAEARLWAVLARKFVEGPNPSEIEVMRGPDPGPDLSRRASDWGFELPGTDLGSIAVFAAALANTEAEAWEGGRPDVATRAYESRRFLIGDRVIHWAVPWLLAIDQQEPARFLLDLGDEMNVAPEASGREGLVAPGEDSIGPLDRTGSIWSGWVTIDGQSPPDDVAGVWTSLATTHPGTAQLWLDLAARVMATR